MSSSQRAGVPDEELERIAALLVRHLLFKHHSQPGVPVKREELVDIVQQQYPNQRGLMAHVIPLTQCMCRNIIAFDLISMDGTSSESQASQSPEQSQSQACQPGLASAKFFILQSTLDPKILQEYVLKDDCAQQLGLRLVVCAIVHGAGGSIPEETLWKLLARMGLREESRKHPAFGSAKETIQQLAKEKYITIKKGQADDGSEAMCVELGPHALSEFGDRKLKAYFDSVCDGN